MKSLLGPALLVLLVCGCSRTIGDACTQNVDCSLAGDRFCDIASPGGYCTVEGCDHRSCPDGSVCVRFFSLLRGGAECSTGGCRPGEMCLCAERDCERFSCDPAHPDYARSCTRAYCASETSERRWCMRPCDDDGGCREGYRCSRTAENGAELVPRPGEGGPLGRIGFCAPAPKR